MTDLADLSARELLDLFATRKTSPVEVMRAVLDRAEAWEPTLKALYLPDPAGALAAASEAEHAWRRGEARALEGIPVTIKDNIATKGHPTPLGTAAKPLVPSPVDAPPVQRLREAGAILWAKTTMPDYGMLSSGLSSFHPLTRNPWDPAMNPGGSSAGAGAAAAAGYGPLHLGTDIGGSVRLPACWCGIFTLKPSEGRVPIDPPYYGRAAGPMTRTVVDSALMLRELAKPDERDVMSLPPQDLPWLDLDRDPKGLRIGLLLDAGTGIAPEPEVRATIENAARLFGEAGARVEPVRPFLTRAMLDGMDAFWRARAWADIGDLPAETRAKVLPYITRWAEGGAALGGRQVYDGMSRMLEIRTAAIAACKGFDAVLAPVSPVVSFPAEFASPLNDPTKPFEHVVFTMPFNMSGQPAASVPAGFLAKGFPIGLQIVGRRFDDIGVMRLARWFETARGPMRPWPVPR